MRTYQELYRQQLLRKQRLQATGTCEYSGCLAPATHTAVTYYHDGGGVISFRLYCETHIAAWYDYEHENRLRLELYDYDDSRARPVRVFARADILPGASWYDVRQAFGDYSWYDDDDGSVR